MTGTSTTATPRERPMRYAKIRADVLAGRRRHSGLIVTSTDMYCAFSFGPRGYDDGTLAGYRLVAVEVLPEASATMGELHEAARAAGRRVIDETTNTQLLLDRKVRAELERRGFDSFSDHEVIGNASHATVTVWNGDMLRVVPDPEGVPHFTVDEADDGTLRLQVNTTLGRERVYAAIHADDGGLDEDRRVLEQALAGTGYEVDEAGVTAPDGRSWSVERFYPYRLVDDGACSLAVAEPRPGPKP